MKPDSLGQAFGRLCEHEGIEGLTLHSLAISAPACSSPLGATFARSPGG
jgi:hypothetical protein